MKETHHNRACLLLFHAKGPLPTLANRRIANTTDGIILSSHSWDHDHGHGRFVEHICNMNKHLR